MPEPRHLVITVHGIRTYGDWQDQLKTLLESAESGVTVRMYRYGFYSSFAFLIPPVRWLQARQFRKFFEQEVRSVPADTRIDLVAHSFGTYLAARALPYLPDGRKINTVIFAGSVLQPAFPWYRYIQSGSVGRVVNECGWDDSVLLLCQCTALLMGMAGRIGFHGMVGDRFVNRYYFPCGHGGYFDRDHRLMREAWVPLLTSDGPVPPHDDRPPLTTLGGAKLFLLANMHFMKVAAACLLLMIAIFIPLDWLRKAKYQKDAERINHIALLSNAQEIPGRDPSHVGDLLRIDAAATGSDKAVDHMIRTEDADDALDADAQLQEAEPQWWERLLGMTDTSREAYRARLNHALANHELVSGKGSVERNRAKAQAYYENAVRSYERVNNDDPAHGSYALCLVDYGQLLQKLGAHISAIEKFRKVREDVFPRDAKGQYVKRPPSLTVDSLIFEADSRKATQDWDGAAACLRDAIALAETEKDKALLCDSHHASAWLHLERLEVNRAVQDFKAAEAACVELVDNERFVFKIRSFNIRHGLALADRLKGKHAESYEQYGEIVSELQELLRDDLKFTPKQRRDLRNRLINSMERRRRQFLRARAPGSLPGIDDPSAPASPIRVLGEPTAPGPSQVERDYQMAIELVGNEFLDTKSRLLFKKVIAQFAADLERRSVPSIDTAFQDQGVINFEFAEAGRTFATLPAGIRQAQKPYYEIAEACMGLHRAPKSASGYFAPSAVEKLRILTVEYAKQCGRLKRENVEMLLLALEILINRQVQPPSDRLAEDSTRMIAVLGETTNVGSHSELAPYFERFQRVANGISSPATKLADDRSPTTVQRVVFKPAEPAETFLFYLRLGPRLELKLTRPRVEPEPPVERLSNKDPVRQAAALGNTP